MFNLSFIALKIVQKHLLVAAYHCTDVLMISMQFCFEYIIHYAFNNSRTTFTKFSHKNKISIVGRTLVFCYPCYGDIMGILDKNRHTSGQKY